MIYDTLDSLVKLLHKSTEIVNYDFIICVDFVGNFYDIMTASPGNAHVPIFR